MALGPLVTLVFARSEPRRPNLGRSLHPIPVGDEGRRALETGARAELVLAHAGYEARAPLPPETIEELRRDLE
jgi:hypothetical protein